MAVMVVTDSSARLSDDDRARWGIRTVPLHILLDGRDLRDGVDPVGPDVCDRPGVTTAGATPAELGAVFREALGDSDGDGVVAVHISAALSSTLTSSEQAARQFSGAVRVVNSRSAGMGTGFVAVAAARAAEAGGVLDDVEAQAQAATDRVRGFVAVQRLDNLRRSGRMGTAASWLGTALAIKPVLRVDSDGRLTLAHRVRTATKAWAALVDMAAEECGDKPVTIAVHHVDNPGAAAQIADELTSRLTTSAPPSVTTLGPVIGVHVGRGAVAVSLIFDD